jgi:hypothetical protein
MEAVMIAVFDWFHKLVILVSQSANALFLNGNPDETVSARAYRCDWYRTEKIINLIFWFDPDHCQESHERDKRFARAVLFGEDRGF